METMKVHSSSDKVEDGLKSFNFLASLINGNHYGASKDTKEHDF